MTEFYLSFATDTKFLGCTIVTADNPEHAIQVARDLGRNPGGEVLVLQHPEMPDIPEIVLLRSKLCQRDELEGGGVRAVEVPELKPFATFICQDCNHDL